MSFGNIVKTTLAGVGVGGIVGAAFIDEGISEFLVESVDTLAEASDNIQELYEGTEANPKDLFSAISKVQAEAPAEFVEKINDALPNLRELGDVDAFLAKQPNGLPNISELDSNIIEQIDLTPEQRLSYDFFQDNNNRKDVLRAYSGVTDALTDITTNMSDDIGKGALVGGGLFAAGAALQDAPSWAEKFAHSVDTRVHGKG